ncbi:DnaJ domain-containing protein [bacterium]|nr:DnaJ domain-containing protein [bacterium]
MGILDRLSRLVKAEINYRLKQTGLTGDEDILDTDLEAEIRRLEEELRQAEKYSHQTRSDAENRQQHGWDDYQTKTSPKHTRPTAYDILGLNPDASARTIKFRYRELAKKYHPDRVQKLSPDFQALAKQKMKDINRAYDLVGDARKRHEYDRSIGLHF